MKLMIAVDNFDPNKGYLEYYLARELSKLGHKVYVFTFGWSRGILRTTLKEGFEVVSIPHVAVIHGFHIPSFSGLAYIYRFIRTEKPDIVHCEPLTIPLSLFFISIRRLSKYKILGSIATQEFAVESIVVRMMYYLSKIVIERYVKNRSEVIFAKTNRLAKILAKLYNIQYHKFDTIPLGADPKLFKFDDKARERVRRLLAIHTDDIVVVYSGRINSSKDLDVLIKALAPIIERKDKVKLLIIGKGDPSYIDYLKRLISELGISGNVIFYPWVHRTKLSDFYSASDIAVWPGISSASIVEAASVGLPIIMARSPIESYGIEYNNGYAFERGNLNDLRKKLETLIYDHRLRKEMGCRSRLLVENKLNWRVIAIQYVNAYKRALDEHRYCESEAIKQER